METVGKPSDQNSASVAMADIPTPPEAPAEFTCSSCRFFGAVTVVGPIKYLAGAKGQCRQSPPSIPFEHHALDPGAGALDFRQIEMVYRIVDAATPACGQHPQFIKAQALIMAPKEPETQASASSPETADLTEELITP